MLFDDDDVIILELSSAKLVYQIEETETIVTRLPVKGLIVKEST